MATTLPVQKVSFRGIYEMIGGIFMPKVLEWTLADYNLLTYDPKFEFRNARGLTFVLIKNNSSSVWTASISVFKRINDLPFNLEIDDVAIIISSLSGQKQNIIGPFSYAFDVNEMVQFTLSKNSPPIFPNESLSLAVITLPQGSV